MSNWVRTSLTDLKQLWKSADPGQRNRLLLAVFHSIYVDLENREVVGFRPVKAFNALPQAMDYREDVEVWPNPAWGIYTGWWRRGRVALPVQKLP